MDGVSQEPIYGDGLDANHQYNMGAAHSVHLFESLVNGNHALMLPPTAGDAYFFVGCTRYDGYCELTEYQWRIIPTYYRVTTKTLTDLVTPGTPARVYTYAYDTPKMDTTCKDGGILYNLCYFPSFTIFFGHAAVTETSPDGRKTTTSFFTQTGNGGNDYFLKGKVKEVQVADAFGQPYSDVQYTYARDDHNSLIDSNTFPKYSWGGGYYDPYADKGIANMYWSYLTAKTTTLSEPGSTDHPQKAGRLQLRYHRPGRLPVRERHRGDRSQLERERLDALPPGLQQVLPEHRRTLPGRPAGLDEPLRLPGWRLQHLGIFHRLELHHLLLRQYPESNPACLCCASLSGKIDRGQDGGALEWYHYGPALPRYALSSTTLTATSWR